MKPKSVAGRLRRGARDPFIRGISNEAQADADLARATKVSKVKSLTGKLRRAGRFVDEASAKSLLLEFVNPKQVEQAALGVGRQRGKRRA